MNPNKILAEALEKYFPKGDKRRGDALVFNSLANIELAIQKKEFLKIIDEWKEYILIPNNSVLLDEDLIEELKDKVKEI